MPPLGRRTLAWAIAWRTSSVPSPLKASAAGFSRIRTAGLEEPDTFVWLTPVTWLSRCATTVSANS